MTDRTPNMSGLSLYCRVNIASPLLGGIKWSLRLISM